jgi:transcriptional regulator with XRE-family HTH domain
LAGLTQKQVAHKIGVTGAQFHRYELGITRIALSRLVLIADAIGVRPDILLSAASTPPCRENVCPESQGQEVTELLQIFMNISDPQCRDTLVALARMMSTPRQQLTRTESAGACTSAYLPLTQNAPRNSHPVLAAA